MFHKLAETAFIGITFAMLLAATTILSIVSLEVSVPKLSAKEQTQKIEDPRKILITKSIKESETIEVQGKSIATDLPEQGIQEIKAPEKPEAVESAGYTNRWGIASLSEEEKLLLAKVIFLEAHNTGLEGCQKVAVVIFNRFIGGWGSSVTAVVSAPGQFSVYNRAATDPSVLPTDQEYQAIESVLNATVHEDIYNAGWLYFYGDGRQNHFR